MRDFLDSCSLWKFAAQRNWLNKTAKAEDFCLRCLEFCWNCKAHLEFNYSTYKVIGRGENGEFIEI
jgi:hypothetical protein